MESQKNSPITPVTLGLGMLAALVVGGFLGATAFSADRGMQFGQMRQMSGGHNAHMQAQMDGMMAALSGKTGSEFDKAFLDEMIVHHEGAIAMALAALQHAERPEIRALAEEIIDAQTSEIAQMQSWRAAWFAGEEVVPQ